MEYDQINHDTSAIDAAMKAARDRDLMGARNVLNASRARLLLSSIPVALIAGTMFIGAAAASAWIMRPHFDFHTVSIDVPKLVEKQVDAPKLVSRDVEIPKLVERTVDIPKLVEQPIDAPRMTEQTAPGPLSETLPPKSPDKAEKKFISRPDYQSADFRGRIVPPEYNELKFEDGKQFWPVLFVNGQPQVDGAGNYIHDYTQKYEVDPFMGDYAYCNRNKSHTQLVDCWVIHNDRVQLISWVPYAGRRPPQSEVFRSGNAVGL
jgi:hypothetical protein